MQTCTWLLKIMGLSIVKYNQNVTKFRVYSLYLHLYRAVIAFVSLEFFKVNLHPKFVNNFAYNCPICFKAYRVDLVGYKVSIDLI